MPRIAEIKSDDNGNVWCNIGRINGQGHVIVLTEEELEGIKDRARQDLLHLMQKLADSEQLRTYVELH